MLLSKLAQGLKIVGNDTEITGIAYNSKKVNKGDLFVALKGRNTDGHLFIREAIERDAAAVMVQREGEFPVPAIVVDNTRKYLGHIAARFYGFPSKTLKTIGITGTNGKTTTSFMIRDMLDAAGETSGLLGTIYYCIGKNCIEAMRTTPEASDIQAFMSAALKNGIGYFIMEVSSAGIEEFRIEGTHFHIACLTNFSREHMEYHGNMEDYLKAKLKLFSQYEPENSVINIDDSYSPRFLKVSKKSLTYGIKNKADLTAEILDSTLSGTLLNLRGIINEENVYIPLPGIFNVYNFLCAASVLYILGKVDHIRELAEHIQQVPGRYQIVPNHCGIHVIVDYAHTPEAMENLLSNVQKHRKNKIITVFGAGGDRDSGKRPLFGEIAEKYSDIQIVTSDNPRTEPPEQIINDILKGMKKNKYTVIPDRKEAIIHAIKIASPEDIVLLIGKGHETYQEINNIRYHFSDYEIAIKALTERGCLP